MVVRYNMHEYAAAVDVFERLLEFQPDNVQHYTNLGRCRKACAAFTLRCFLLIGPQLSCDGRGLCGGGACVHARRAEQAVRPFVLPESRALQVNALLACLFTVSSSMFSFRAKAKDFDGAGECMQCHCILVARSLSVAEAAFLRALELSPGDDSALFNLAVLYGNNSMEEEMRSTLHQLLQVLAHACSLLHPAHAPLMPRLYR